jgi:hypothetical protein
MRESHYQSARSARAKDNKERNASLQINKKRRVFSLLALFFLALISLALTSLALILFALSSPRFFFFKRIIFIVKRVLVFLPKFTPSIRNMITITTTQLNNRGGWSGGIKRKGEGRVDGRFGGEAKGEDGRRDQEGRGKNLKGEE